MRTTVYDFPKNVPVKALPLQERIIVGGRNAIIIASDGVKVLCFLDSKATRYHRPEDGRHFTDNNRAISDTY